MDQSAIDRAADFLAGARRDLSLLDGLPDDCRPDGIDDAYRVQDALVARLGAAPVGWKIGCTNAAIQAKLGCKEPNAGHVLSSTLHTSPARLPAKAMFGRGLEAEFAFRLARDLPAAGAPYDRVGVGDAVAGLHPAIEVVGGRYRDWTNVGAVLLAADNVAHCALVIGAMVADWRGIDLAAHEAALAINGAEISRGTGANVLGHPLEALAWLANHRAKRGAGLKAGDVITTGSICPSLGWAKAGDAIEARFGDLGVVRVDFD